jgi:hypothetical protein
MSKSIAMRHCSTAAILMAIGCGLSGCSLPGQSGESGEIYPQGTQLLFSAYSIREPELSLASASGFTAIGPYYGKDKALALSYSEQSGLPVIYSVGPKIDLAENVASRKATLLAIGEDVQRVAASENIAIWNISNEELRHWKPAEMDWLTSITAVIRANDPKNRPIMMYEPNHRRGEQLVITGTHLDLIAKGSYSNYVGMKTKRSWLRWSFEQMTSAAEATGGVPLAVLWMARDQLSPQDIAAIPDWVRHDVYLSLISGAKGILVFSAHNKRAGFNKHFDSFFAAYSQTATELNGPLQLGQVFLFGEPQTGVTINYVSGPKTQTFSYQKTAHTYPSVHHLHQKHNDRHYLFLVNSANNPVTVAIKGIPVDAEIVDVFSQSSSELAETLELGPLKVVAYSWK